MQPTTIYLPEEAQLILENLSKEKGKTIEKLIEEMVMNQIECKPKKRAKSMGMGASGRNDLSSKVDQLFWTEK